MWAESGGLGGSRPSRAQALRSAINLQTRPNDPHERLSLSPSLSLSFPLSPSPFLSLSPSPTLLSSVTLVLESLDRGSRNHVDTLDLVFDIASPIYSFCRPENMLSFVLAPTATHSHPQKIAEARISHDIASLVILQRRAYVVFLCARGSRFQGLRCNVTHISFQYRAAHQHILRVRSELLCVWKVMHQPHVGIPRFRGRVSVSEFTIKSMSSNTQIRIFT